MASITTTTTLSTDEELLTEEATRQRRSRRSGRFLAGMLALAAFFGAVGYVMVHPGTVTYGTVYSSSFPLGALLFAFGILDFAVAVILLVGAAYGARPRVPWGDPAPGDCPTCGHPALRQDDIVRWERGDTLKPVASGTVTLCETPGCEYATAVPGPR